MRKQLLLLKLLFIGFAAIAPLSLSASRQNDNHEILLLNSYHKGFKWTDNITQSVVGYFNDSVKYRVFVEYMDSKRFQTPEYFAQLVELYRHKYKNTTFQGIICSDNNALDFYLQYGPSIWGKIPVVFCGLNNPENYKQKVDTTNIFGVEEKIDIETNLKLALKFHPNVDEFIVVGDNTLLFPIFYEQFTNALKHLDQQIKHRVLIVDNTDQLADKLGIIDPRNKAIYLLSLYVNRNGIPREMAVEARLVVKNINIPVYGNWDFLMPGLIIGGNIISGTDQGLAAADLMHTKLATGKSPARFTQSAMQRLAFDYNQMVKFGIAPTDLPNQSEILYKELKVWEKYKTEIATIMAIITLLLTIIIFLVYNILQRKRAELDLIQSENRLELALEGANQGLWDFNIPNKFIYINKEFAQLLGYQSPKELSIGINNWVGFVHTDDLQNLKKNYNNHKYNRIPSISCELRMVKKDGNPVWVLLHGKITEWENTEPVRITGSILNINEQKEFENELRWAKYRAEESDRLKSSFLANMSHEIRTPMNAIIGFSDLLNSYVISDEERKSYLLHIKYSSESLLNIINDIIDISKIESGQMTIFKEEFDLDKLLQKVIGMGEALIARNQKNISLLGPEPSKIPLIIKTDQQRLEQILLNLLN